MVTVIFLCAFVLRYIHSADPIGGFHSFNEAWYSIIASNYSGFPDFLFPQTVFGRVDYNVSPFLSQLMYVFGKSSDFSKPVLVLIPIFFSVMTVIVIYELGAKLFDRTAGIVAALFYATIPVSVMVGRNIQTDPVYVFFLCSSLLTYLTATDKENPRPALMALAGLLFGLAFYSKQFAALLLPAIVIWELLRNRNLKWFGWGHVVFGAAALLIPGPFFIYHLVFNHDIVIRAQSTLSASQYVSAGSSVIHYLLSEYFWGASPAVLLLAVAGILIGIVRRSSGALLVLIVAVVWNWFFLHWHGHSYYMLFLMPYICLAAGAAVSSIKFKPAVAVVAVSTALFAACLSLAIMCTVKYGYNDLEQLISITKQAGSGYQRPLLIVSSELGGSYYPILRYYGRDIDIISEDDLGRTGLKEVVISYDRPVLIAGFGDARKRMPPTAYRVTRDAYGFFIYGYQFSALMVSEHFFKVEKLDFFRNGPAGATGVKKMGAYQSLFVTGVPPGEAIPFNKEGLIDFRLSGTDSVR